jgi:hypothetical protein
MLQNDTRRLRCLLIRTAVSRPISYVFLSAEITSWWSQHSTQSAKFPFVTDSRYEKFGGSSLVVFPARLAEISLLIGANAASE